MLEIVVPENESYDYANKMFVKSKETRLQLEHSLISVAKWESKWMTPFLSKKEKTIEETIDYIKCMTINPGVDPNVYYNLTAENIAELKAYIESPMTATWFSDSNDTPRRHNNEDITSELIYYWMIAYNIPSEYQKWHLNRLLTLIKICGIKNSPDKKMTKAQTASHYAKLNAARRKANHH